MKIAIAVEHILTPAQLKAAFLEYIKSLGAAPQVQAAAKVTRTYKKRAKVLTAGETALMNWLAQLPVGEKFLRSEVLAANGEASPYDFIRMTKLALKRGQIVRDYKLKECSIPGRKLHFRRCGAFRKAK